ncbi:DNA adenine methyltransferase YhdJ [termite gut metagenome]|uniref:DNA adenine methyltransferase YhdJ n=1 Tax=termite gut metagenome TaxID=433724 RepID=A0A5J4T0Q1_9ZZZZ
MEKSINLHESFMNVNRVYNEDCTIGMSRIPSESIDCILTDPPYLYLKNQKLDRPFDENLLFGEVKRVLKKNGFIVMFGRGDSFYRWNTILADLGFTFKEDFVWDKCYCSSPLMSVSRVHENLSIHTKGKGTINKVKVPYLQMKQNDIDGICQDIKRMRSILKNTKSLDAVLEFLENNKSQNCKEYLSDSITTRSELTKEDRCTSVMRSICFGMNEKTIIRTDFEKPAHSRNHSVSCEKNKPSGDRACNVMQSIQCGMNEKTIIKQSRDHYKTIHPTQKPVYLLERLLALTTKEGDTVLDPFAGSCSTAAACINTSRNYICYEIDKEYYDAGVRRLKEMIKE